MKKNTILYVILFFLVLMNGFFLFNHIGMPRLKPPIGQFENPRDFIAKKLNFKSEQLDAFLIIKDKHQEKMKAHDLELKNLKDELFNNVNSSTFSNSALDSLTTLIGNLEKQKETEVFNFFKNIQGICDEKQKEHFEKILKDALHPPMQMGENGPPPPRNQ